MKSEDKERLEKYRDSVFIPLKNTDPEKWPIRAGRIGQFTLDLFSAEFINDLKKLQEKGYTIEEIGRLFHNPSRLWRMSHHFLKGLKMNNFTLDKQRSTMLTFLDLIRANKYDSEFNNEGKNIILSSEKVKEVSKGFHKSTPEASVLLHKLAAMLWGYAETIYFVAHEVSVEIHGPYELDNGKMLMVRDYFNLKPLDLWKECEIFPYNTIQIYTIYNSFDIMLDVYNNPYYKDEKVVDSLISYRVMSNGDDLDIRKINLNDEISSIILSIASKVESWSLKEIVKKYAEIFWYRKKPLKDALGEDWKPPKMVYQRIETGEIPPESRKPPDLEKLKKQLDLTCE